MTTERGPSYPYGETDASKWAAEFVRLFPDADEGLMLAWFANAIETGRDAGAAAERERIRVAAATARRKLPPDWPEGYLSGYERGLSDALDAIEPDKPYIIRRSDGSVDREASLAAIEREP